MRIPELRVRRLTGVSWGSGLTRRRQGEPVDRSDEEEDAPGSMRLGVHELPRRREKDGGEGYSSLGVLPPSMYSRTASNVRPGTTPADGVEPAGGHDAVGGLELLGVTTAEVGLPERAVGDVARPLPRRPRQRGADTRDLRTPRCPGRRWWHRDPAGADSLGPGHPHVRRDRVLGLEEEPSFVLVKLAAAEAVHRRAIAWKALGHG